MKTIVRLLLATTVLIAAFAAGVVAGSMMETGLPSEVTVMSKQTRETPCGREYVITFRDEAGTLYRDQLFSKSTWTNITAGDRLPARQRWDGTLVSVETHPAEGH